MPNGAESPSVNLRPLEREDLPFVHQLDNNASVMRYWFEEPYEAFVELCDLYDKHIHDQNERRFIIESLNSKVGLVELVEIDYVHRRAEFQIIIAPAYQGQGYATVAAKLAMEYAFAVLNLYKLYLIVDKENTKAIHIYNKLGFHIEGELIDEFFVNGSYHTVIRMCTFQHHYFANKARKAQTSTSAHQTLTIKPDGKPNGAVRSSNVPRSPLYRKRTQLALFQRACTSGSG